jgi:hypothetical protein
MDITDLHARNCGAISHQEKPEYSLRVLKLTKHDCSACIAPSQDNSNPLFQRMDYQGDSNWQMSNTQASSDPEGCLRHSPKHPNRGRVWYEVEVREQLDEEMIHSSMPGFTSVRSLPEK